jgi:hypothetical protein
MKKLQIYLFLLVTVGFVTLNSCKKPKPIADFLKQNCLKVKEARENGAIVYTLGGATNSKPAYAKFKINLSLVNGTAVEMTEIDGTLTKGNWSFSDPKISITGLNPALTDAATGTNTRTTAEFTVSNYNAKTKEVVLTSNTVNLKVGTGTVSYTMIPCE